MIQFGLAISIGIIDPVIDDPKLIRIRVDIDTRDNPDAFDDPVGIAAVLASHQFDLMRIVLVGHGIIEDQKPVGGLDHLTFDIVPDQFRRQAFSRHIAIESIMAECLAVVGKVRQRIIDLADQKILAIVQACDVVSFGSHTPKLIGFLPARQTLSFA